MTDVEAGNLAGGDERTGRSRAMAAYRWYDRSNWLFSLFKTKSELALLAASAGVVGITGAMTVSDAVIARRNAAAPPIVIEAVRSTKNSTVFEIIGFDQAGRRGVFDVVVLNKEFMWVRKSADALERQGRTFTAAEFETEVLDPEVRDALAAGKAIISVGTASQEGQAEEETHRAGRRAVKTAEIVARAIDANVPIWTLNLGQYAEPCETCESAGTSWQRPFIAIAVKEVENGTDLGQALADALSNKKQLPSPQSYSAFALTKFR